jgi:hypothetical protein
MSFHWATSGGVDDTEIIAFVTRNSKVIQVFAGDTREIIGRIIPWGINFGSYPQFIILKSREVNQYDQAVECFKLSVTLTIKGLFLK